MGRYLPFGDRERGPGQPASSTCHTESPHSMSGPARCCSPTRPVSCPRMRSCSRSSIPSVGSDRDLALETEHGRLLVGPDNGLLAFLWHVDGGVRRVHSITLERILLRPIAPSFHARDVLAPAAAFLAAGGPLEELGRRSSAASLVEVAFPSATVAPSKIECEVLDLNRFGNVLLNVTAEDYAERRPGRCARPLRSMRRPARRPPGGCRRTPTSSRAIGA